MLLLSATRVIFVGDLEGVGVFRVSMLVLFAVRDVFVGELERVGVSRVSLLLLFAMRDFFVGELERVGVDSFNKYRGVVCSSNTASSSLKIGFRKKGKLAI